MSIIRFAVPWAVALTASACVTQVSPATEAAQTERVQCGAGSADANTVQLIKTATVLTAEPIYAHIITGRNDLEKRVAGAKIVIRPPEGITTERMTRVLQCHSARALLGQLDLSALPDDPYWLPDAWVNIDVQPDGANYIVKLETSDVPNNIRLFARAKAYANARVQSSAGSDSL